MSPIIGNPIIIGKKGGSGAAISIVDTLDSHGGIIRTINAVDLSGDTVTSATLLNGVTAHNAAGAQITGSYEAPVNGDNLAYGDQ